MNEELNLKQELFCQYIAKDHELFGNASLSYAEAYEYNLETLDREKPKLQENPVKYGDSEYDKAYNVCSVEGRRLLRNPKVKARVTVLLNELLKDEVVDSELAKTILQGHDLTAKMAAIKEYNKLRSRITPPPQKLELSIPQTLIDALRLANPRTIEGEYTVLPAKDQE